jgi:hypothetical protein
MLLATSIGVVLVASALRDNASELMVAVVVLLLAGATKWVSDTRVRRRAEGKVDIASDVVAEVLHQVTPNGGDSAYDVLSKKIDDGNSLTVRELRNLRREIQQEREERHEADADHGKRLTRLEDRGNDRS